MANADSEREPKGRTEGYLSLFSSFQFGNFFLQVGDSLTQGGDCVFVLRCSDIQGIDLSGEFNQLASNLSDGSSDGVCHESIFKTAPIIKICRHVPTVDTEKELVDVSST